MVLRITSDRYLLGCIILSASIITACSGSSSSDPKTPSQWAKVVSGIEQNSRAAATDTNTVLDDLNSDDNHQTALDAQTLHDHLTDFRSQINVTTGLANTDGIAFIDAENELKNAMGAVVTWTGTPNDATEAQMELQVGHAAAHWNTAIIQLWTDAGMTEPAPTIVIPSAAS